MVYKDDETPCTKVGKYFNKFINNELEEFKAQYIALLTEINNTFEDGDEGIDEEAYSVSVKEKMLELITAQGIEVPPMRCALNNVEDITYTITHNIFKKTTKDDFYLQLELALYDEECNYLTTINLHDQQEDYPSFTSKHNIYDKTLKCPDDAGIHINLSALKELPVHHILFMIRINDLNANTDKFDYARYRLCDFDINYAFDTHSFGEEYNLVELRGPVDEPVDDPDVEPVVNGALFFNYYLHKNEKYGWFIEDLHSLKTGTL